MSQKHDPAMAEMMRCYLTRARVSWPYLALLFGALAFIVGAPLLLR